jgi:hypothetical protein
VRALPPSALTRRGVPLLGAALALTLSLVEVGCSSGPPPLEIVPAEAPSEPPAPPRYLLELRVSGEATVPLPPNDRSQRIESLFWVVPEGDYELVEVGGERLLKTSPEASLELRLRFALTERELPQLSPAEARLLGAPPAAGEKNRRWASGLDWSAVPRLRRWPEIKLADQWWPYDPERGELVPRARTLSFADLQSSGLEGANIEIWDRDDDLATSTPPAAPAPSPTPSPAPQGS